MIKPGTVLRIGWPHPLPPTADPLPLWLVAPLRDHTDVTSTLVEGRTAFDRQAWAQAFEQLTAADANTPLEPEDLDRLATAAYLVGRDDEGVAARTRAHDGFLARGEPVRAARSALWLGFATVDKPGRQAQAGGWLARARRLIESHQPEGAEVAFLLCTAAFQRATSGDAEGAHAAFARAADMAARFGDPDTLALARHGEGRSLIRLNRRAEGLALLDEVMVGVSRGEVGPMVAGVVYCSVIGACHELFDWRRAQEWTDALAGWCAAHPDVVPFRGTCLVRRSEVMQLRGDWPHALDEAERACAWLAGQSGGDAGAAYYQLAELHRLRGEFDRAEQTYRLASQAGGRLYAGLALLRLGQGQADAACAAVRRSLEETRDPRARVLVLRGAIEIHLAAGDVEAARTAAAELATLAAERGAPFLQAGADSARGAVALAAGDVAGALAHLREAASQWRQIDAPYELARVRTLVGLAYRRMDDVDGAALEFEAAQEVFERLGAAPDAARVAALAAEVQASATAPRSAEGLTGREVEVLRQIATGKTNRAIAADLGISEKTVARHVSNIFTKLDLTSRAAATAYAYEHRLV